MNVSREDADLFYSLMWRLQFYVSRQHDMLPHVTSVADYTAVPTARKLAVREVLWANPKLIDAYVAAHPDGLDAEKLAIVSRWNRFVTGRFYVFRFLKKHTIFIGENSKVYGVLGLRDRLEDVFGQRVPILVDAVLLPFKGSIIYDGMLDTYNIQFGGGVRSHLNDLYMTAKQNDRIITTLEPELVQPEREAKRPDRDWRSEVDDIVSQTEALKGGPSVQSSAFSLLRASAALAQAAVHNPDDLDALWDLERRVRTNLTRLQTTLDRVR
jgi:hypothetical protein